MVMVSLRCIRVGAATWAGQSKTGDGCHRQYCWASTAGAMLLAQPRPYRQRAVALSRAAVKPSSENVSMVVVPRE
ncbi:MAG: hypothetical protein AAGI34_19490, partial [Pseudomonadota bacterium]